VTLAAVDLAAVQTRTVRVLVLGQVLGGVGLASGIAVTGLLAEDVSGSTTLSGLAATTAVLGAAAAAVPLARLSSRHGRRAGLGAGWLTGCLGAVTMVLGAVVEVFAVLLVGALLFGAATAANLQSRFAATDLADPRTVGRSLAVVVWATTVGAVAGPNLTGPGGALAERMALPELSGPLLFSVVAFAAGGAVSYVLLRPDPLLLARAGAQAEGQAPQPHPRLQVSLGVIARNADARAGLLAVATGHAVMVAVMTMTPVHMRHGGAELRLVGFVISVHIAGMYAVSPLVGWLVDRVGRRPVILIGQVILLAAAVVAGTAGHSSPLLTTGLFLLGLGWSCSTVAGSTLLARSVDVGDRPGVQGAADLTMNLAGALAGGASGVVLGAVGYGGLNAGAAVLVLPIVVLVLLTPRAR
jgi:MFS family permease